VAIGYLVVAVLAAAVAVFALQNGTPTPVRFIAWSLDGIPLAGLILGSFAAGLITGAVPLVVHRWRARSQVRRLEDQVRTLEAQREQTPLRPSSPRPSSLPPPGATPPGARPPDAMP
jgi:uncharacterized integral membrane protein